MGKNQSKRRKKKLLLYWTEIAEKNLADRKRIARQKKVAFSSQTEKR